MSTIPFEVVSNAPEAVAVTFASQPVLVSRAGSLMGDTPALFLLCAPAQGTRNPRDALAGWVNDLKKFVAVYADYQGPALMLSAIEASVCVEETKQSISGRFGKADDLFDITINTMDPDYLWYLVMSSALKSDLESSLLWDEAVSMCEQLRERENLETRIHGYVSSRAAKRLLDLINDTEEKTALAEISRQQTWQFQSELNLLNDAVRNGKGSSAASEEYQQKLDLMALQLKEAHAALESQFVQYSPAQRSDSVGSAAKLAGMIKPANDDASSHYCDVLFDESHCIAQGGTSRLTLLHHQFFGWKKGVNPHPLFDTEYYLGAIGESLQTISQAPLLHFARVGARIDLSPHPEFDSGWYRSNNPDVVDAGIPSVVHFLEHGWSEGRSPNPDFDPAWYLSRYQDVADAGINPFLHYLSHGRAEGRLPNADAG